VPKTDFPSILELVPQAKFVVIEQAGHWVHAETPVEFMDSVQDFLANS
jgi:pimeloyl-ACP methyl ester carboxylesterase